MEDSVKVFQYKGNVSLILGVEDDQILALGQKLKAICPDAYMNGYNWDALLHHYLEKNAPDILEGLDADPEAGMYEAHWPLTPENEEKAKRFQDILRSLIENEEELCRIVREEGDAIEWD